MPDMKKSIKMHRNAPRQNAAFLGVWRKRCIVLHRSASRESSVALLTRKLLLRAYFALLRTNTTDSCACNAFRSGVEKSNIVWFASFSLLCMWASCILCLLVAKQPGCCVVRKNIFTIDECRARRAASTWDSRRCVDGGEADFGLSVVCSSVFFALLLLLLHSSLVGKCLSGSSVSQRRVLYVVGGFGCFCLVVHTLFGGCSGSSCTNQRAIRLQQNALSRV